MGVVTEQRYTTFIMRTSEFAAAKITHPADYCVQWQEQATMDDADVVHVGVDGCCYSYWDSHVPTGSANSTIARPIFRDLWATNLPIKLPLAGSKLDTRGMQGPAWGYNNTCPRAISSKDTGGPVHAGECPVLGHCVRLGELADHHYGGYEDAMLAREVLRSVEEHNTSSSPYYLFWAPHIAHVPVRKQYCTLMDWRENLRDLHCAILHRSYRSQKNTTKNFNTCRVEMLTVTRGRSTVR